jgi:hypothetical protein
MLKVTLLASGFALALFGTVNAATPLTGTVNMLVKTQTSPLMQLADSGKGGGNSGSGGGNSGSGDSDDNGSDDNGSDDNDSDDNSNDNSSDDNGGSAGNSSDDNGSAVGNSNDDNSQNASGRKKRRIPGGSGCDDAGDIAEHAECSAN